MADYTPETRASERPALGAVLRSLAVGINDSRSMLERVETALLDGGKPGSGAADLQQIDRIGQRLGDLSALLDRLASGLDCHPAPFSSADLSADAKLAEIRALLPGPQPATPIPRNDPRDDSAILF